MNLGLGIKFIEKNVNKFGSKNLLLHRIRRSRKQKERKMLKGMISSIFLGPKIPKINLHVIFLVIYSEFLSKLKFYVFIWHFGLKGEISRILNSFSSFFINFMHSRGDQALIESNWLWHFICRIFLVVQRNSWRDCVSNNNQWVIQTFFHFDSRRYGLIIKNYGKNGNQ